MNIQNHTMIKEPLQISYHKDEDILVINGVHYSGDYFRVMTNPRNDRFYMFERTKDLPEVVTARSFDNAYDAERYINK